MKSLPSYLFLVLFSTGFFVFDLDAQKNKIDAQLDPVIDSLLYNGDKFRKAKEYEKANELYTTSLNMGKSDFGPASLEYAWSLYKNGMLQYRKGKFDQSIESYYSSALLFEKFGSSYDEQQAKSYFNAARSGQMIYDYSRCIKYADKVLNLVEYDNRLYNFAIQLLIIGNYELQYFRRCSNLIQKAMDNPRYKKDVFLWTTWVSSTFKSSGMAAAEEELAVFESILEEYPLEKTRKNFISFFRLATMYKNLDIYEKANYYYSICEYLSSSLDYSERKDLDNYLRFRLSYGDFLFETAAFQEAEDVYLEMLDLRKKYSFSANLYDGLYENLSVLYLYFGDYQKAIYYLNKFEEENNDGQLQGQDYSYWHNLGTVYAGMDQFMLAFNCNTKALDLLKKAKDKNVIKRTRVLSGLAENSMKLGELELGKAYLDEAFLILGDSEMNSFYRYLKGVEAYYYLEVEDFERSKAIFDLIFDDSLWIINKGYREKKGFYKNLIDLNIKQGDLTAASANCLEFAQMVLNDIREVFSYLPFNAREQYLQNSAYKEIGRLKTLAFKIGGEEMEMLLFELSNMLKGLQLSSTKKMNDYLAEVQNPQIKSMLDSLESLKEGMASNSFSSEKSIARYSLERKIRKAYFENSLNTLNQENSLERIKSSLGAGDALVEFFTYNDYDRPEDKRYAASILVAGEEIIHTVDLCERDALESKFTVVDPAEAVSDEQIRGIKVLKRNTFREVYDLLWAPFSDLLKGVEQVYYSPSGLVNKINLSALQSEKEELLLDRHQMVVLSSSSALLDAKEESIDSNGSSALIIGGVDYNHGLDKRELKSSKPFWEYLEGSAVEGNFVEKIIEASGTTADYLKGAAATEQKIEAKLNQEGYPKVLHIATHGFYLSSLPEGQLAEPGLSELSSMDKACLVFAGANKFWKEEERLTTVDTEGIFTGTELAQLNLRGTELVVLSACESGLGDISDFEGVFGLPRALKIAGAKYVIMTLSSISDKEETINFVNTFYKFYLLDKVSIPEAFNKTQEFMLNNYGIDSSWSEFVLYK